MVGVYVPTQEDLAKLQAGKKINCADGDEASPDTAGGEEVDVTLGGGINDASIRIASLTS